ncbi:Homeodomain-like DNA binding domain-containing transcription factor [Phycomyces blakesleeanus NRRL 1555(-)]|uniref:Homeodomain-like DNA binding domain-containing transcription factor n=1 Tax=Phycomyces blakesleeanus (strain ATCC 8743b / DSM 1359 / FGSC 10004 / NBRC 33097 / NRRL 1555) TaxID=763407 RepID=A0A162PWP7_PHYB8|nr:Homeodomain-like DNA binding domain-containing transcription factor [Phycomyces blakesleeanus NRRL 1555(-)]OAD74856.1 Homeodomain-like DNA binding domain-containing transcription factor [Phycomyces blakesleeanus NRRL 1555(-)]|eukprot:XP_018292896.1 Homeodomain-like DNA binding domain-containing transcription factor [Phycomyces blakesleeanus NRRL 1555(-)]
MSDTERTPVLHTKLRKGMKYSDATHSTHIRHLIIEKSKNQLKAPSEISKELNILRSTMNSIIGRFERTGSVEYKSLGSDFRTIIKDHHKQFILDIIDSNNTITLAELQQKLPKEIFYSQNCIFINEAGFNFNLVKGRARVKAEEYALMPTKSKRAKNIVEGGTAGPIFKEFVQQLVEKLDAVNAEPYNFVVNNTRIYYNFGLREWLEQRNLHKLKFIPPYSPFLNPVEKCFSKLKNFVKKHPLNGQEMLVKRIKDGNNTITRQDCEGWCISDDFFAVASKFLSYTANLI